MSKQLIIDIISNKLVVKSLPFSQPSLRPKQYINTQMKAEFTESKYNKKSRRLTTLSTFDISNFGTNYPNVKFKF